MRQDPERPLVVSIGRLTDQKGPGTVERCVVSIGRLTDQKGLGLVRYAMDHLMQRGVQVAILGTGDKDHEDAFRYFDAKYGDMMCARIAFDNALLAPHVRGRRPAAHAVGV